MTPQFFCGHIGIIFEPRKKIQMDNGCSQKLGGVLPIPVTEQLCWVGGGLEGQGGIHWRNGGESLNIGRNIDK